jgi:PAS domain S-box-containing protein
VKSPFAPGSRWSDLSRVMATMVVIIGGAGLAASVFGTGPSGVAAGEFGVMRAGSAASFMLLGLALLLLPDEQEGPAPVRRQVAAAAAFLGLVAALAAALRQPTGGLAVLATAAVGVLLLASRRMRAHSFGQALAAITLFAGTLTLIAYAFDLRPQRSIPQVSISGHGALAFVFLGMSGLLARPAAMPMAVLLGDLPSARLGRVLIVGVLLMLPGLGWLWLEGEQRGMYGDELGAALMVATSTAILALFIWLGANHATEAESHLDRMRRLYAALSRTIQTIARFQDRSELLSAVCRTAVEQGGFRFAWIGWTNPEGVSLEPAAQAAVPPGFIDECVRKFREVASLRAIVRERLARQEPVFVNDVEADPIVAPRRPEYERAGVRAVAAIPILVANRLAALLLVYSSETDVFATEERQLLREMASEVGFALQHLEHGERHRLAVAALEHSESRLGSILASLDSGVWSVDPRTHAVLYVNPAFERIFALPGADLLADSTLRFRDVHPEDRETVARFYPALEAEGNAAVEYRLQRPDGALHWIHDRGWVVNGADGTTRYDGIATDITQRKRTEEEVRRLNATLERRVAERTAQLENANRELNAFSYSVSHDLRAPLRAIEGFSALLSERLGSRLDPEELGFLQRIRRAVERMASLIDGMLQLARLSTQPLERMPLDLSAIAREVSEELQREAPERRVEWRIQPGLVAHGDPALLRAVMQNLIGNAWKFTARVAEPVIEIGSRRVDAGRAVFVRDNGAGFDMAFSDRLFDAFHRMHGEQEFPGTGIGLATVKRIVSRHGGRIWAEAAPGAGATFCFTLGEEEARGGLT